MSLTQTLVVDCLPSLVCTLRLIHHFGRSNITPRKVKNPYVARVVATGDEIEKVEHPASSRRQYDRISATIGTYGVHPQQVGDAYPLGALTQTQRDLAQDFVELGLLFKRKAKSTRFYPTSIAVNLIFGSSPAGGGGGGVGQRQPQPAGTLAVREIETAGGRGRGRQIGRGEGRIEIESGKEKNEEYKREVVLFETDCILEELAWACAPLGARQERLLGPKSPFSLSISR